jgi:DNA sulfur modification protein DndC
MQQSNNFQGMQDGFFDHGDFESQTDLILSNITEMYLADSIPWVVGYSGGKDSSAVLQLVWQALARLDAAKRHKHVYVITTDTLVENPIVASWVDRSLERIEKRAGELGLPISPHKLTPKAEESYWVNLIGRGYPAPRPKFRWCTERMKIKPANHFINSVVQEHGEAIVVLGTRKAESAARAQVLNRLEKRSIRDGLRPHTMMPNSFVYSPIEDWTNDDVWTLLGMVDNPWGHSNKDLLELYRGANPDRECPVVTEEGTPSCGDSRFGCWVCTLVEQDKSMSAMIQNDEDKEWMKPLLAIRDELIPRDEAGHPADRHLRDFRRMSGRVDLVGERYIPGPYKQEVREEWLRRVLQAEQNIRTTGPEFFRDIQLISLEELRLIRQIWVNEKHELEDRLPHVYSEVRNEPFPDKMFTEELPIGSSEIEVLRELCEGNDLHFQLVRELLSVELQHRHMAKRSGLFPALEKSIKKHFFEDADDAISRATDARQRLEAAVGALQNPDFYIDAYSDDGQDAEGEKL